MVLPNATSSSAEPFGPAAEPFGQPLGPGPLGSSVETGQVGKLVLVTVTPAGSDTLICSNGGGKPPYSVPSILISSSSAAPAPYRLPVCGEPAIGTKRSFV